MKNLNEVNATKEVSVELTFSSIKEVEEITMRELRETGKVLFDYSGDHDTDLQGATYTLLPVSGVVVYTRKFDYSEIMPRVISIREAVISIARRRVETYAEAIEHQIIECIERDYTKLTDSIPEIISALRARYCEYLDIAPFLSTPQNFKYSLWYFATVSEKVEILRALTK